MLFRGSSETAVFGLVGRGQDAGMTTNPAFSAAQRGVQVFSPLPGQARSTGKPGYSERHSTLLNPKLRKAVL